MGFTFRPAVREMIRLLIGLSGGTGSGKTFTAMRLAKGMSGGKRFAVIDTENGRASMYADFFDFDVVELSAPFTPARYLEAIVAAEKAGYGVILVDSMSHEWAGEGGILDMQEDELERFTKGDDSKREANKMRAWIRPKMEHKSMVAHLLQLKAHVVMCFRAEPKIDIVKEGGKTKIVPKETLTGLDGWVPICEKNLPYELTASFLLMAEKPGIPKPIKLQEQHRKIFDLTKPITEESGVQLAQWASGVRKDAAALSPTGTPVAAPNGPVAKGAAAKPSTASSGTVSPEASGIKRPDAAVEVDPSSAVNLFKLIEKAPDLDTLKSIVEDGKSLPMADADKKTANELYAVRKKQLSVKVPNAEAWI